MKCCLVLLAAMLASYPTPVEEAGKWGYRNATGKVVIQPRLETAGEFSAEGLAAVVDEGGWAYIDAGGQLVIRPLVVNNGPDSFQDGLARFRRGGGVGFLAQNGPVVIEARFTFALPSSEGLAAFSQHCQETREGGAWGC